MGFGIEVVDQIRTVRGEPILLVLSDIQLDPATVLGAPSADYDEWLKFATLVVNGFEWVETIIRPTPNGGPVERPWTGEHSVTLVLHRGHLFDASVGQQTPFGISDVNSL